METDPFELSIGDLGVKTTHGRGHTVEEVAEMAPDTASVEDITVADTLQVDSTLVSADTVQY